MDVKEQELWFIYEALQAVECELETMERESLWFVSDSRDRIASSLEILGGYLGVDNDESSEEPEQKTIEFYEDLAGIEDYLSEIDYDE